MIKELLNDINDLEYSCIALPISLPAVTNWERKLVIYNPDSVTPYYLKHEIIHIKERHHSRLFAFNGNDERNPNERDAENKAIHELMKHHIDTGGRFNYVDFMLIYGVPAHLEQSVITEMSDINMYAI
ncbi:hypothetical protein [Weissella confusa]|uniref:hypothetical protein n=1 Tax=Weissella confusa TaxID=1583 RepID=UPI0015F41590|nr:hypothetical protein [Weissella confusa]MBA5933561.1 hypothetical protein [Weissella confusa]MCT0023114.1 hypothetical protein [Weissella confusa]